MPKATDDDAMNQELFSRLDALSDLVVENMAPLASIRSAVDSIGIMVRDVDARAKRTEGDVLAIKQQLAGEGDGRTGLTARLVLLEERVNTIAAAREEKSRERAAVTAAVIAALAAVAAALIAAFAQ